MEFPLAKKILEKIRKMSTPGSTFKQVLEGASQPPGTRELQHPREDLEQRSADATARKLHKYLTR